MAGDLEAIIRSWFGLTGDNERRGYLRVAEIRAAVLNPKVLDALLDSGGDFGLNVPGKLSQLRRFSPQEKLRAVLECVDHHIASSTSPYYRQRGGEVLAAAIWNSRLANALVCEQLFRGVRKESQLLAPAVEWLRNSGLEAHAEIPLGKKRADVLGHRAPGWLRGRFIVAIELKNDVKEFERAIDQMTTYRDYAHHVYLAAAPALAMEYLDAHGQSRAVGRWDHGVLDRKLEALGFGFLLIEGRDVVEHLSPATSSPDSAKQVEVVRALTEKTKR